MASFDHANNPGRPRIAVPRDGDAGDTAWWEFAIVQVMALGNLSHRACSLAGGENNDPPGGLRSRQMLRQALRRMRRRDCGVVQAFEEGAGRGGQREMFLVISTLRRLPACRGFC